MKIALCGYGKMGKTIERIAIERDHEIVAKIDIDTIDNNISDADVAIDFSIPKEAFNNIINCFDQNMPIVSGTTGWLDKYSEAVAICKKKNGAFIYASNYSLGVNLFFELNKKLAIMMHNFKEYDIQMEETHHTQKLDAPSGTAITLAEDIIENSTKNKWTLGVTDTKDEIPIVCKRIDNVPGIHKVLYNSLVDELEFNHTPKAGMVGVRGIIAPMGSCQKRVIHEHCGASTL